MQPNRGPGSMKNQQPSKRHKEHESSALRQIVVKHLREERFGLALAAVCMLGLTAMELLSPWPIKIIIDHILLNKPAHGLLARWSAFFRGDKFMAVIVVSASIIVISTVKGALAYGLMFITSRIGYHMVYKMRREVVLHLQRLSLLFHNRARSGEMLTKLTTHANDLKAIFAGSALHFGGRVALLLDTVG